MFTDSTPGGAESQNIDHRQQWLNIHERGQKLDDFKSSPNDFIPTFES